MTGEKARCKFFLPPLYTRIDSQDGTYRLENICWPIVQVGRGETSDGKSREFKLSLAGVFSRYTKDSMLTKDESAPSEKEKESEHETGAEKEAEPPGKFEREATVNVFLGGLFYHARSDFGARREVGALGPLIAYARSAEAGYVNRSFRLWPVGQISVRSEPTGTGGAYVERRGWFLPFLLTFRSDNYGAGQKHMQYLWPLGEYFRGESERGGEGEREIRHKFLPLYSFSRRWKEDAEGKKTDENLDFALFRPLIVHRRRPGVLRSSVLLGLFSRERREGYSAASFLWGFYNHTNDGEYFRRRILWIIPLGRARRLHQPPAEAGSAPAP